MKSYITDIIISINSNLTLMSDFAIRLCVFTLFITLCLSASNCGGNCPTCDCGTSANYPDLTNFCSGSVW